MHAWRKRTKRRLNNSASTGFRKLGPKPPEGGTESERGRAPSQITLEQPWLAKTTVRQKRGGSKPTAIDHYVIGTAGPLTASACADACCTERLSGLQRPGPPAFDLALHAEICEFRATGGEPSPSPNRVLQNIDINSAGQGLSERPASVKAIHVFTTARSSEPGAMLVLLASSGPRHTHRGPSSLLPRR